MISDVGAHKVSIAKAFQPKKPNRLIISNGLASMGIAIPGSIGAKLASPKDPIICITGDGGALMNFAEDRNGQTPWTILYYHCFKGFNVKT